MLVIGVAGGTGSGKTTVVRKMSSNIECAVVSQDSYYKDNGHIPEEERKQINFDHPDSIEWELLLQQIKSLKEGHSIDCPVYSFITCTRESETVLIEPKKIIFIEGILVLTQKAVRDICDIKVFVDAPSDERLIRVINRDIDERGRDINEVLDRYLRTVKPMHEQFIEPSKRFADIIVPQGGSNAVAIDVLTRSIQNTIA